MEALETAGEEPHEDHFTVLPPRDGDVGDAESELEDVPEDLENEDGFEAAGEFEVDYGIADESESGDVDPYPEHLLARVFAYKTFHVGENVQALTFLWMILAFKLNLRKSFPTSPHSLNFALGVKSSHLP